MLDKTAPLKEIKTRDKSHKLYYNKYIRNQKKLLKPGRGHGLNSDNNTSGMPTR